MQRKRTASGATAAKAGVNTDPPRYSVLVNAQSLFAIRQDQAVFDRARAAIPELLEP